MISQISCEELRCAVVAQMSRGLRHSAKWLAVLLAEVSEQQQKQQATGSTTSSSPNTSNKYLRFGTSMDTDSPQVLLAKTYFDLGEYGRAAHALRNCRTSLNARALDATQAQTPANQKIDHKALFLRGYSLYLQGEKEKEQLVAEATDPMERCKVVNKQLLPLAEELKELHTENALDAFGLYLYAMVLKAQKINDAARSVLIQTVNAYPYLWCAWMDLAVLCDNKAQLRTLTAQLVDHWMKMFFATHALIELPLTEGDASKSCLKLLRSIPCSHSKAQLAMAHYNSQEYDAAKELFAELLEQDPFRLEGMDSYSNILFVEADSAALSTLAHAAVKIDKFVLHCQLLVVSTSCTTYI